MALEKRLEKLEKQAQSKVKEFRLCGMDGKAVEAEIIQKPTPMADGLAKLTDGSELPVEYRDTDCILIHEIPPNTRKDKLLYIPCGQVVFFFGAPEGFFDDVEEWQNRGDKNGEM